jgi:hypothetical protein
VGEAGASDEVGEEVGDAGVIGDEAPRTDPGLDTPPAADEEGEDAGVSADPKGSRPHPSPAIPTACGDGAAARGASETRCPATEATAKRYCASTEGEAGALADPRGSRPRPSPTDPSTREPEGRCMPTAGDGGVARPGSASSFRRGETASRGASETGGTSAAGGTSVATTSWAFLALSAGDTAAADTRGSETSVSATPRAPPPPLGVEEDCSSSTSLKAEEWRGDGAALEAGGARLDEGDEDGLVRPCIKARTRDGEGDRVVRGGEATKYGVSDRALATISLPLAVPGE